MHEIILLSNPVLVLYELNKIFNVKWDARLVMHGGLKWIGKEMVMAYPIILEIYWKKRLINTFLFI
jgi:hypothetical protein